MKTLIIHGPQGCGKTRNGERLREHFGCTKVVELDGPDARLVPGALHLTCDLPSLGSLRKQANLQVLTFDRAIALAHGKRTSQ